MHGGGGGGMGEVVKHVKSLFLTPHTLLSGNQQSFFELSNNVMPSPVNDDHTNKTLHSPCGLPSYMFSHSSQELPLNFDPFEGRSVLL